MQDDLPRFDRRNPDTPPAGRRGASAWMNATGDVLFRDAGGGQWLVYDRRGADRRQMRAFVGERGEERECPLEPGEIIDMSVTTLERQFARSVPL